MTNRSSTSQHFWQTKKLSEMTRTEWESLCDGCGLCCLNKVEDENTGRLHTTSVACRLLNHETGRCTNYKHRRKQVDDCMMFTPKTLQEFFPWLPESCAYKRLARQQSLPEWHPLLTGIPESRNNAGRSVSLIPLISEDECPDPTDWYDHIIRD